ncbi:hypothetical protein NL108_012630 [Boleophthalmus pectinirostris]|uniref:tax1-binding protein 1 homolog A-like n=1 Tax=Boleophthalmus pectinirostris TaxID=150288 RepID=UPI00243215C8|nr:tax1-binding protein 1 homolog A-like [Boleophthalmus pectinirostris]KAJ0055187.1 hypothetical protein NL108_012630 [Boleophthalmus pectinirostris]
MSSFQVVDSSPGSSVSIMETSNFAHVIFQNVGKSFLPQAPLECHYTLTPYIAPHPKDWVGIFKVGWSTARDYYTFLWSPMPENYESGSTVHRTVVFQGYYVPKSDGEFYQFCYVTHSGDIRGASTPFQFRAATPTEELLTVTEDESNSDILVVSTKTGLLQRVEEAQQERRELLKTMRLLQEDKQQLQEEHRRLAQERDHERDTCALLRTHNQELLRSSQSLSEEREEVRRRLSEATERVRQLEEDLLGVTQRGLQKETELHCLRERLKKLTGERDSLESQLKNEKDERDLYKAHLRSTELENTKLSAELQMLKAVELNREVTIAQFQEELERLRLCVAQRDGLEKELLQHKTDKAELSRVREQLRQAEEQLQASRQQASLLASELRDSASARDHSMTELYRARVEADKLRASLSEAQAECQRIESQLDRLRSSVHTQTLAVGPSGEALPSILVVSEAEVELQREVEELKLRLHMAAEHYKEKYRECQRLRRQVAKLNSSPEAQGEPKRNVSTETTQGPLTSSPESPTAGNIESAILQDAMTINPEENTGTCALIEPLICPESDGDLQGGAVGEKDQTEIPGDLKQELQDAQGEDELTETVHSLPLGSWVQVDTKGETRSGGEDGAADGDSDGGDGQEETDSEDEDTDSEEETETSPTAEEASPTAEEEEKEMGPKVEEKEKEEMRLTAEEKKEEVEEKKEEARPTVEEEEKEESRPSVEEELALMEQKWKEQCAINETLKQRLANEEERFRMQMAERACEVADLKRSLALALRDKEQLLEELQRYVCRQREQETRAQGSDVRQTMVLRYPLPYPQEPCPPPLVPQQPPELRFGNPYSSDTKECVDAAVSPDLLPLPPPEGVSVPQPCAPPLPPSSPAPSTSPSGASPGAPGWAQEVVCIQPSRSTSPPDSAEHPPASTEAEASSEQRTDARTTSFCFDSSGGGGEAHRRCPLCELIFPPHFEQRSFEQHVESHWKICPVCSEHFPLHCQQQQFERHVLTHFDGHVLNFHQTD